MFNVLGARTLSVSGRQLFGVDKFRDTGKPLIAVLADPKSIFMTGLARFKRRSLYANITNDRTAVWYTTSISKTDPYTDLSKVKVNYLRGYENVILDPVDPVRPATPKPDETSLSISARNWLQRIPLFLALTVFVPVGVTAYMINAVYQTTRSSKRVKQHESGLAGINVESFRVNMWMNEIREGVEEAYEDLNNGQNQEYLGAEGSDADSIVALERKMTNPNNPTLALAPYQFSAIQSLDALGWRKYPVWIHSHRHSHAAIVVRVQKEGFEDGQVILNHFAKDEFLN